MKKILIGSYITIAIIVIYAVTNGQLFDSKKSKAISAGERLYNENCLACHGGTGKGEGKRAGTAINNQHFLNSISNQDLFNYVKFGRQGTDMPAYAKKLSDEDLHNLVSFIREWQTEKISLEAPTTITGDPERGKGQYNLYCLSCHGEDGAGKIKMGTALANPQYLKYTTDRQIWTATAFGREETRMGPSLKGLEGARQLKKEDISDIVRYIRSLEKTK
ncbi:c-type cytochrome [Neobacillus kokaensis]|uniref:Cytochrome c domain-containing protein n=1 Tax=Neobacillus kokaensis TaxID=2759023 RepID=A0ABQ3MZX9_9BACI|nr:c-type cytochrome [Neobacillus kokaensis]GHH96952.1 hypothetical protein AM1BK_04950 [Neobacillus kokaensis]